MTLEIDPNLLEFICHRCKQLVEGMQTRVKRNPDDADFRAAILDELKKYNDTH